MCSNIHINRPCSSEKNSNSTSKGILFHLTAITNAGRLGNFSFLLYIFFFQLLLSKASLNYTLWLTANTQNVSIPIGRMTVIFSKRISPRSSVDSSIPTITSHWWLFIHLFLLVPLNAINSFNVLKGCLAISDILFLHKCFTTVDTVQDYSLL